MSTIKSKPMLFSGEMVRALLDGRKSQTRRVVKPQPHPRISERFPYPIIRGKNLFFCESPDNQYPMWEHHVACPYGQPGDLLWVREAWGVIDDNTVEAGAAAYRASEPCALDRWRPSIHMPRWASRLTLEITGVRVERIKDISHGDAISEGVAVFNEDDANLYYSGVSFNPESWFDEPHKWHLDGPREAFFELWDGINFDRDAGVATNPWVWVIEFTVHHCNVDALIKQREAV